MEIIALILMIVFIAVMGASKKKPDDKSAAQNKSAAARSQIGRAAQAAARMSPEERRARLEQLRQQRADRLAGKVAQPTVVTPAQALNADFDASLTELRQLLDVSEPAPEPAHTDEEGCVGGSMAHTHEEGESREEHARHMAAMTARDAEEAANEVRPAIDAAALRRAVVMSEVLGRPKALRRNTL